MSTNVNSIITTILVAIVLVMVSMYSGIEIGKKYCESQDKTTLINPIPSGLLLYGSNEKVYRIRNDGENLVMDTGWKCILDEVSTDQLSKIMIREKRIMVLPGNEQDMERFFNEKDPDKTPQTEGSAF